MPDNFKTETDSRMENMIKRGIIALEDCEWENAQKYFNQVLDIDAECAKAYFGLFMAEKKLRCTDDFINNFTEEWLQNRKIHHAKRFGGETIASILDQADVVLKNKKAKQEQIEKLAQQAEKLAQLEKEETIRKIKIKQEYLKPFTNMICCGEHHVVGLKIDGTVLAIGSNEKNQCNVNSWTDIIAVAAGENHTVGLRANGTVIATGDNKHGQCNVHRWENIVAIATGDWATVGLKADGTVTTTRQDIRKEKSTCDWAKIKAIAVDEYAHIAGLSVDGKVKSTEYEYEGSYNEAMRWENIIAIDVNRSKLFGLTQEGKVKIAAYTRNDIIWDNVVAISAGREQLAGLKLDGTVVIDDSPYAQWNVSNWSNIVAIATGRNITLGLKSDGTVVVADRDGNIRYDGITWRLFPSKEALMTAKQEWNKICIQKRAERNHLQEEKTRLEYKLSDLEGSLAVIQQIKLKVRLRKISELLEMM